MITTLSGTYTYEELEARDKKVKQLFKDYWNDKIDVLVLQKEKERMLKNGEISMAELLSLQYEASFEKD